MRKNKFLKKTYAIIVIINTLIICLGFINIINLSDFSTNLLIGLNAIFFSLSVLSSMDK